MEEDLSELIWVNELVTRVFLSREKEVTILCATEEEAERLFYSIKEAIQHISWKKAD